MIDSPVFVESCTFHTSWKALPLLKSSPSHLCHVGHKAAGSPLSCEVLRSTALPTSACSLFYHDSANVGSWKENGDQAESFMPYLWAFILTP